MKQYISITVILLLFLSSCTDDINLTVAGGESKIVIEGSIENGNTAEVIVTRNSPLSKSVDISNILVNNALVYVSNGIITDTLSLDTMLTTPIPFVYKGKKLIGEVGGSYNLTVIVDGKSYTATTTIPQPVALDSVWWAPQPPEDTLGYAWGHLSEPAGTGNAYRWFAKTPTRIFYDKGELMILDRRYIAPFGSVFDDKFIDGKSFDFWYYKGTDPTEASFNDPQDNPRGYYNKKDTIYIKFCTIDYKTTQFYTTYETMLQNNGNPFASGTTVLTNISAGGLGIWAGYGATYDTIMPKP